MDNRKFLKVPGEWLELCGFGSKDRVFRVLDVIEGVFPNGTPATFVTVDRDGTRWIVHAEWRNAEFVDSQ